MMIKKIKKLEKVKKKCYYLQKLKLIIEIKAIFSKQVAFLIIFILYGEEKNE